MLGCKGLFMGKEETHYQWIWRVEGVFMIKPYAGKELYAKFMHGWRFEIFRFDGNR